MSQRIAGPGLGLPLPQNLYPTELQNANQDAATNHIAIPAGDVFVVPAGEWYIGMGMYLVLQYLDPITNVWVTQAAGAWEGSTQYIFSDGYTVRIANVLCCPIGAYVTNAGSSYVQGSTTITVTGGGGSTWLPIIGGQLATQTWVSRGAGYGIAPTAILPAPAPAASNPNGVGGIPASGYFTISSGTVSAFSFTNLGAGYQAGFTVVAVPSPFDPNLATGITAATLSFSLTSSGSLTGVLCTNSGAPISNPANITLTVNGVGTQATAVAIVPQTIIGATVSAGGAGFGVAANPGALLTTVGGAPGTAVFAGSPETLLIAGRPRPANIGFSVSGTNGSLAAQGGTVYDGGWFYSLPTAVLAPGAQAGTAGSIVGPTLALTMGSRPDIAKLQPAA